MLTKNGRATAYTMHSRSARGFAVFAAFWAFLALFVPTPQASSLFPPSVKVPPVEEALQIAVARVDAKQITLDVLAAPAVYVYKHKFAVSSLKNSGLKLGKPIFPATERIDDETFGKVDVFRGAQQITLPYTGKAKTTLTVDLMACHGEAKVCYPPHRVKLDLQTGVAAVATALPASTATGAKPGVVVVSTEKALNDALRQSRGRYAMVDVWATWCAPCKQMEKTTLIDPDVRSLLDGQFVTIKVDVSKSGPDANALMKRFGLAGPPGFVFYGKDGKEVQGGRLMGYVAPEKFLAHLKLVTS
jgi:thiol:disulfide interchange protein